MNECILGKHQKVKCFASAHRAIKRVVSYVTLSHLSSLKAGRQLNSRTIERRFVQLAISIGVALMTVGCGGGDTSDTGVIANLQSEVSATSSMALNISSLRSAAPPSGALTQAVVTTAIETPAFFAWAQRRYPQFFTGPQLDGSQDGNPYRFYPGTGNTISIVNGDVFFSGPMSKGARLFKGSLSSFAGVVAQASGKTFTCFSSGTANCIGFDAFGEHYLSGFGGLNAILSPDPTDPTNQVGKLVKSPANEIWAGATAIDNWTTYTLEPLSFVAGSVVTLRVYSPAVGEIIMLKIENSGNNTVFAESRATTTVANAWETLSFDFSRPTGGSVDPSKIYNRVSVFPHMGTKVTADMTFYVDELRLATQPAPSTDSGKTGSCTVSETVNCIGFEADDVGLGPYIGLAAAIVNDPRDRSNKVLRMTTRVTSETFQGLTVYAGNLGRGKIKPVVFGANKTVTMRVYSPAVGETIMLKLQSSASIYYASMTAQATTTRANAWETLTFDFSGSYDAGRVYDAAVIFPHFGSAVSTPLTYYIDELSLQTAKFTPSGTSVISRRPLPEVYGTGKAINYGHHTRSLESEILQDLTLMRAAGFNLIRVYSADALSETLIRLGQQHFPDVSFQLGIGIGSATADCVSSGNAAQIAAAVSMANRYPNIVAVSVGNETSLIPATSGSLSANCLAGYIKLVREQVAQAVTTNDIAAYYAGNFSGHPSVPVIEQVDFASIQYYPFQDPGGWDWKQEAVPPGPGRATATMNAVIANTQSIYNFVVASPYINSEGAVTTLGATMPVVIGEIGWKARTTDNRIVTEVYLAGPVNQKWYYDLLQQWRTSASGRPAGLIYFVAFDEAWKGVDDGWGLWDEARVPRYALCGTTATNAPACNPDLYVGARYFQ
jgi:exo-beta-1,3-glucanase (GH17 family)